MDAVHVFKVVIVVYAVIGLGLSDDGDTLSANPPNMSSNQKLRTILEVLLSNKMSTGSGERTEDSSGKYLGVNFNVPPVLYHNNAPMVTSDHEHNVYPLLTSGLGDESGGSSNDLVNDEMIGKSKNHVMRPAIYLRPKNIAMVQPGVTKSQLQLEHSDVNNRMADDTSITNTVRGRSQINPDFVDRKIAMSLKSLLLDALMTSRRNSREDHVINVLSRDLTWDDNCSDGYDHCGGYFPSCCEGFICLKPLTDWDRKNRMFRCFPDYFVEEG